MDLAVVLLVVAAAGAFVARRAWRAVRGGTPGCCGGACPAATSIASDIQRAARGCDLR